MKIVPIFADRLFAFHYETEPDNELSRLLKLWNDTFYLYQFIKENKEDIPKRKPVPTLINQIIDDGNKIDETLYKLSKNKDETLEEFFKPLNNQEYRVLELSKRKGRKNYLRLYAIRIDINCYVITGGAIKFTHLMKDRAHTEKELRKIDQCRDYLKDNGIIDADSFYEFLNEKL
jgi:hypothetical protein